MKFRDLVHRIEEEGAESFIFRTLCEVKIGCKKKLKKIKSAIDTIAKNSV